MSQFQIVSILHWDNYSVSDTLEIRPLYLKQFLRAPTRTSSIFLVLIENNDTPKVMIVLHGRRKNSLRRNLSPPNSIL